MADGSVIVLGGSCFMGKRLVDQLDELGTYTVITVNRGTVYWGDNHRIPTVKCVDRFDDRAGYSAQISTIIGSMREDQFPVTVVDFCAYSPKDITESLPVNLWGCVDSYIFISTDSVYECVLDLPEDRLIKESDTESLQIEKSLDKYGFNKLRCEAVLEKVRGCTKVTCIRLPDVIGPFDDTYRLWALGSWIQSGVPVYVSDPRVPLSVCFSDDVVRYILHLMKRRDAPGVINFACEEQLSMGAFIDVLRSVVGARATAPSECHNLPKKEYLPSIERRKTALDLSRMKKEFGFVPTPLDEALRATWQWLEHAKSRFPDQYEEMISDLPRRVRDALDGKT